MPLAKPSLFGFSGRRYLVRNTPDLRFVHKACTRKLRSIRIFRRITVAGTIVDTTQYRPVGKRNMHRENALTVVSIFSYLFYSWI